jgi:pimeloyl-ACP methyl ester carboxylesterase
LSGAGTLAVVLVVVLVLITVGSTVAWSLSRQRQLAPEPPLARALPERAPPAPVEESVPVEVVQEEPSSLVLQPRMPLPEQRRWVVALTALAPLVAAGAWLHHRRFVGYHAHKGLVAVPSFSEWVSAEARGAGVLGYWHVMGLIDSLSSSKPLTGRLVVCLHGYTQNATNFLGLRRSLQETGRPTVALSLGYRLAPMSWYAHRLERELRDLASAHPDGFDLVAHSMGGVVLRMVLSQHSDLRAALRTVVTLGSPHHGTAAARGIPLLPEIRALRRRSELLRALPHLSDLLPHARLVSIAGDADTVVYPLETALAPGAQRVVLPGIGHAGLLTEPVAWKAVHRALEHDELRS